MQKLKLRKFKPNLRVGCFLGLFKVLITPKTRKFAFKLNTAMPSSVLQRKHGTGAAQSLKKKKSRLGLLYHLK